MLFQAKVLNGTVLNQIELHAQDVQDALRQLKSKGLIPVTVHAAKAHSHQRRHKFPLSLFSQELLALLESGLNLVEAIEALALKVDDRQAVMHVLLQALHQGKSFSAALDGQPEIFPLLFRSTVKASERTGDLIQALARYIAYDNQISTLKKKVVSASIYPLLLMGVGGLVILFLLGYVVPKFSTVYEGVGTDLPWMSKVMLNWGGLIAQHGAEMLSLLAVVLCLLVLLLKQPALRAGLIKKLWQLPTLGERLKLYQLARFYRTLGMLLRAGTPIMQALEASSGLLDDQLAAQMELVQQLVSQGQPLSSALQASQMTTPIGERMLMVGERGGNIADMMERIAVFYDEDLARWIDWFTKLFEPLLMLFIGLVIGLVVLLLYMPIFELAGQVQ